MDQNQASATLLAITTAVGTFNGLLPHLSEVRRTKNDPAVVNDVRLGEIAASSLVVAIGLSASKLVGSEAPAMVAVASAIVLVLMYESVLHATPSERKAA